MNRWQSYFAIWLLPLTVVSSGLSVGLSTIAGITPARAQTAKPTNVVVPLVQTPISAPSGHWAQTCITDLTQQRIFTDNRAATNPNATVTRAEYAAIVQRVFPQRPTVNRAIAYRDIRNHPDASAIQYAQQTGFWLNEGRNEFKPGQAITRSQAFGGLANGLRYTSSSQANKLLRDAFKDGRLVPDYLRTSVAAALEQRLIINYPDRQRLNPNQSLRQGELAALLCQALPSFANTIPTQYIATVGTPIAVTPPRPTPTPPTTRPPGGNVVVPTVPITPGTPPNPPGTPMPPVTPPRVPTQEIRGAWITNIDSMVLFDAKVLKNAMQDLARLKFNTVYPVVWNWGYTLYPSAVAQRTVGHEIDPRYPGLQNRDPLAEVVQHGHQKGLTVIPWFEFGFMAPADSELVKRHPDWVTQKQDGTSVWMQGQFPRVWLNPFKPEVQQFILDLVDEMMSKYNVDGIQFDDNLGLGVEYGYDPYTVALYRQENGGKEPPKNPKDPAWMKWRADKMTQFMARVHRQVKLRKPGAIVALAPNSQKFSYENYLQDWHTWRQNGYIEELIVQIYRTDIASFESELMQPEVQSAKAKIPVGIGVLTGLKNKPVPMYLVQQKIQIARDRGFSGVSFFFYETMWNMSDEPTEYRQSIFRTLFDPAVTRPNVMSGTWIP